MKADSSWGVREAVPSARWGMVSTRSSPPSFAKRSQSSGAVSSAPMAVFAVEMTSPASSRFVIYMMETPVSASPSSTAHWMGAAPRYLGSRDAWTLMEPYFGTSRSFWGRIWP